MCVPLRTPNAALLPKCKNSVLPSAKSNVSIWKVSFCLLHYPSLFSIPHTPDPAGRGSPPEFARGLIASVFLHSSALQGHAIKNQDLLVASGVTSLKGSDALTAVDEDIEAAVRVPPQFSDSRSHVPTFALVTSSRIVSWLTSSSSSLIFERVIESSLKSQSQSPV